MCYSYTKNMFCVNTFSGINTADLQNLNRESQSLSFRNCIYQYSRTTLANPYLITWRQRVHSSLWALFKHINLWHNYLVVHNAAQSVVADISMLASRKCSLFQSQLEWSVSLLIKKRRKWVGQVASKCSSLHLPRARNEERPAIPIAGVQPEIVDRTTDKTERHLLCKSETA